MGDGRFGDTYDTARLPKSKTPSTTKGAHRTCRMCSRACLSGTDMHISRSKRPARLMAGSMESAAEARRWGQCSATRSQANAGILAAACFCRVGGRDKEA